jgi:hypothetical protein
MQKDKEQHEKMQEAKARWLMHAKRYILSNAKNTNII